MIRLGALFIKNPDKYPLPEIYKKAFGEDTPKMTGLCLPNRMVLVLNSVDLAQDVYVTKNMYHTKDPATQIDYSHLMDNSLVF